MTKEAREVWYGGPYDGTYNGPSHADGMVRCEETKRNLFIFECFDQWHFYALTRQCHKKTKRMRYKWVHAGVCPTELRNRLYEDWKERNAEKDLLIELDEDVREFCSDEEDEDED